MQIAVAHRSLAWLGGTQTYAVTVAEHLQRLGHDVVIVTEEPGVAVALAESRGVRVIGLDELSGDPAVVLAQDSQIAYAVADRRPEWPQVSVIHSDIFDADLPPALPQLAAVVSLYDRVDRRARAMDLGCPVVRLAQPVDVERFKPTVPLREEQPVVLVLGNYVQGGRMTIVEEACRIAGLELVQAGAASTGFAAAPEELMNTADVVIGKARVVLEAMACGRAAYVYDHNGGEGWVTAGNAASLGADNFGGQRAPIPIDAARLAADLGRYDPVSGSTNRDYVVAHHGAAAHAAALVDVLRSASTHQARTARDGAFELARLTRLFATADAERFHLRGLLERQAHEHQRQLALAERRREEAIASEVSRRIEVEDRLREVDAHYRDARARVAELDAALASVSAAGHAENPEAARRPGPLQRTLKSSRERLRRGIRR